MKGDVSWELKAARLHMTGLLSELWFCVCLTVLYPSYTATFCNKGMQSHSSWCLCPVHVRFCHGFGLDPATEKLCWLAWHHPQAPYARGKTWKVPSASPFLADFGTQQLPSRAWQQGSRAAVASFCVIWQDSPFPLYLSILIYNIFIICNHHFFRGSGPSKANEI